MRELAVAAGCAWVCVTQVRGVVGEHVRRSEYQPGENYLGVTTGPICASTDAEEGNGIRIESRGNVDLASASGGSVWSEVDVVATGDVEIDGGVLMSVDGGNDMVNITEDLATVEELEGDVQLILETCLGAANAKFVDHLEALALQAEEALNEWRESVKFETFRPVDSSELRAAIYLCKVFDEETSTYSFNNECYAPSASGTPVRMELWDVSQVDDFSYLFYELKDFNVDVGEWQTSQVTNMDYTFAFASSFQQDLSSWDLWGVYNSGYPMVGTFANATSFDVSTIKYWPIQPTYAVEHIAEESWPPEGTSQPQESTSEPPTLPPTVEPTTVPPTTEPPTVPPTTEPPSQ